MKEKFLKVYLVAFRIFVSFSSIKFMYELIDKLNLLPDTITFILVLGVHIGTYLLINSGRTQ